jgi:integrative and conjugative element protein (TIGR02256 family)
MPQALRQLTYCSKLGTITFHRQVLQTFGNFQQTDSRKTEAGGQLFASFAEGRIDVLFATGPSKKAARGRYFFRPNRREEQEEIRAAFKEDLHFIGDWHTHPEPEPIPSSADIDKASQIFRRSKHELNGLLLVIVGTAKPPNGLWGAWITPDGISPIRVIDP